jgi:hypothetical protein
MKMTIVTTDNGAIVGMAHGAATNQINKVGRGGLAAGPGQQVREVEVPDELAAINDGEELARRLTAHIAKA